VGAYRVLVLTGPTGTGKSDWAARVAQILPIEIVSVDSALVYRSLDIGTAKPPPALRKQIPHHLIDICDPIQSYSAGQFVTDAMTQIGEIQARGRAPLLVGGTMLYLRALFRGIADLPKASAQLRQTLNDRAAREGWPALHRELERLDPQAAARIHPNDPQRIQRALEVCYATGQPISQLQRTARSPLEGVHWRRWALVATDRAEFHARLARRFDEMMSAGFLDEVVRLRARGDLTPGHPAIRAVGYRQLWSHLDGECSLDAAIEQAIAATRQLAKRQMTWLRAEPGIEPIDPQAPGAFDAWSRQVQTALHELGR
jgi:tRNA dimethylallyltransferase